MPKLEIAATTVDDAVAAEQGSADSIEISRDLSVGGLTPTFDVVRRTRDAVKFPIHVMLRPHAPDFIYTEREIDQILADAQQFKAIGVNGLVFGAVTAENRLDLALIRRVAQAAAPLTLTVHRALDFSVEPEQALAGLIGIVPRVLTAGPAPTAWEGRAALAQWISRFGTQLRFVISGSLKVEQMPEMLATIRAHEYHFGSAARWGDAVDPDRVRLLRTLVKGTQALG